MLPSTSPGGAQNLVATGIAYVYDRDAKCHHFDIDRLVAHLSGQQARCTSNEIATLTYNMRLQRARALKTIQRHNQLDFVKYKFKKPKCRKIMAGMIPVLKFICQGPHHPEKIKAKEKIFFARRLILQQHISEKIEHAPVFDSESKSLRVGKSKHTLTADYVSLSTQTGQLNLQVLSKAELRERVRDMSQLGLPADEKNSAQLEAILKDESIQQLYVVDAAMKAAFGYDPSKAYCKDIFFAVHPLAYYQTKPGTTSRDYFVTLPALLQRIFTSQAYEGDRLQSLLHLQHSFSKILVTALGLPTKKGDISVNLNTSMHTPTKAGIPLQDIPVKHNQATVCNRAKKTDLDVKKIYFIPTTGQENHRASRIEKRCVTLSVKNDKNCQRARRATKQNSQMKTTITDLKRTIKLSLTKSGDRLGRLV